MQSVIPHNVEGFVAGQPFLNSIDLPLQDQAIRIPGHEHIDHIVEQW